MRIALYHNLPSGGAKRTLAESTLRLARRHQIEVYTLSSANHEFADIRPHVHGHTVYPYEPLPLLKSPLGRLNQAIRLLDLYRIKSVNRKIVADILANGYDLVIVQPCQVEKSPSLLRYLTEIPTVYYCHEPLRQLYEAQPARPYDGSSFMRRRVLNRFDPLPGLYTAFLKRNDRQNISSARRVLVNSIFTQNAVAQIYGINSHVSYHGINADLFQPLSLEKHPSLLSVGSLTPLKGFDFLIEAVARIPGSHRPVLNIASNFQNPPEREFLNSLTQELSVKTNFLGSISDSTLVELYNQTTATVYAPLREPFGLVPLESMACETPVVAVAEGGIQETILDGQTGYLTERDPDAFAKAIQDILKDPRRAAEMGKTGRKQVLTHWTWDAAVQRLEDHLLACISEFSPSSLKPNAVPSA